MHEFGYAAVKVRGGHGSALYQFKDMAERRCIPDALDLIASPGVEIVVLSDPEVYGEYQPYQNMETARDLFRYTLALHPAE